MTYRSLATIDDNRSLTHDSGQVVYLHWDQQSFVFTRSRFSRFARTLQQGLTRLYAGRRDTCVVAVDDEHREVWIEDVCLTLNRRDYRVLLNAILTTETRLHGFRAHYPTIDDDAPAEPPIHISAPPPLSFCWN